VQVSSSKRSPRSLTAPRPTDIHATLRLGRALRGVIDALLYHEHPLGVSGACASVEAVQFWLRCTYVIPGSATELRMDTPGQDESGNGRTRLRLGPDSDDGLNVGGVGRADWAAALCPTQAESAFTVPGLLHSIEEKDALPEAPVPPALATVPLAYQRQAVTWMLNREALAASSLEPSAAAPAGMAPPTTPRLHPAFEQLVAADGQVMYAHRTQGIAYAAFPVAQRQGAAAVASFLAAVLAEIELCNVCSCQEIWRRHGQCAQAAAPAGVAYATRCVTAPVSPYVSGPSL
jgi:hypothetical protein